MAANGIHHASRPLKAGIFAPIPTFFLPDSEDLDLPSFETHVKRVGAAGVGPLIAGSMGEAIHLSHSERITLIQTARKALDSIGLTEVPIIAGTGAGSTRETIELSKAAAQAGADYAIVIASGYFAGALSGNNPALKAFWKEVAEKSPIPVMIYSFPGASGGIDPDSDLITDLARECPNICGVKLTCGNVGKLTRIADVVSVPEFASSHPRKNKDAPFLIFGGFADFLVAGSFAQGHGAIIGLANIAPYACVKLFQLTQQANKDLSVLPEANRLQGIIARADFTIAKTSIAGTKAILGKLYGQGGNPRGPLAPISADALQKVYEHPHTQALIQTERELAGKTSA